MISKTHFNKLRKDCFCQTPELIENYEQAINDITQVWECHHRDEIRTLSSGMVVIRTREELIENGRYYNCPPNELIFLTKEEHTRIHSSGRKPSELAIKKLIDRNKKGYKGHKVSDETKAKIAEANSGKSRSDEICKRCSKAQEKNSKSEFGKKFREHFNISCRDDKKLYFRERLWYLNHNHKCRWE